MGIRTKLNPMGGRAGAVASVLKYSFTDNTSWYIDNNGDLYGCGNGSSGQQGNNSTSIVTTFTKRASNVKEVSASSGSCWYIDNNGDLYGCGSNYSGAQGSGTSGSGTEVLTFTKRASNAKTLPKNVDSSNSWYIDNNGDLYGCGSNQYGTLGNGSSGITSTFTKIASNVAQIIAVGQVSWYLTNNGDLYGCGINYYGNQGNGTHGTSSSYTVMTFTKRASNVKKFAVGGSQTVWYIDNNDDLYGCGSNYRGQQGNGTTSGQLDGVTTFTKRASNVKEVSANQNTTMYINNNNELYLAGLKDNSGTEYTSFTKMSFSLSIAQSFAGAPASNWYLTESGHLYATGANNYGQLGTGDTTNLTSFAQIKAYVKEICYAGKVTWYIDTNDDLYGCGYNYYGQQGSGTSGSGTDVLTFTKRN